MSLLLDKIPGRTLSTNNGDMLWFGGTSYLGIPHVPDFQKYLREGLEKVGSNWGSSRANMVKLKIYEDFERVLARISKAEAAITVSSGMLAGHILQTYIFNKYPEALNFYSPRLHVSLWPIGFQIKSQSQEEWANDLIITCKEKSLKQINIFTDTVASPGVAYFDFDWLKSLPSFTQVNLVVDDTHAIGVLGKTGEGRYSEFLQRKNIKVFGIASLNKALGIPGGVILADSRTVDDISKMPLFLASSPIPPAYAYAGVKSNYLYISQLNTLRQNIESFYELIKLNGNIRSFKQYPAIEILGDGVVDYLYSRKILIPSFSYPTPQDKPINRLVISALHNPADVYFLAEQLNKFFMNG